MYKWKKLGIVIKPQKNIWWMKSHAMIPTIERISENIVKIYFSGRNDKNQSYISWALIDLNCPNKVIEYSLAPVLTPGRLGCFDDNGVTPSCIIKSGQETLLYYIGWNPGSTVRMHIYGGLAISKNNGSSFERYSEAPIIERSKVNPFINTAPFVLCEDGKWIMYYVAGVEWIDRDLPRYNIQIAHSVNGKEWRREGEIAINFLGDENALARPFVFKENNLFKMFFSSKSLSRPFYRIKYAESINGRDWVRRDDIAGTEVSKEGFDSEMMEYAALIDFNGKKIMFYNGNNYGYDGVLVAVQDRN